MTLPSALAQRLVHAREVGLLLLGRRRRFVVEGDSMLPTLRDGDHLLCRKPRPGERHPVGQIVLARQPGHGRTLVKRIAQNQGELLWLLSDNPQGTDSRGFGWVTRGSVLAVVTCHVVGKRSSAAAPPGAT